MNGFVVIIKPNIFIYENFLCLFVSGGVFILQQQKSETCFGDK